MNYNTFFSIKCSTYSSEAVCGTLEQCTHSDQETQNTGLSEHTTPWNI